MQRHFETKDFRGLEIHNDLEFGQMLHVQLGRFRAPDIGGPSLRDYRTVSLPPGQSLGLWGRPEMF